MNYIQGNLTNCDREQVHLIGAIQPIGVLVAAGVATGLVSHLSENVTELLGWAIHDLMDQPVSKLFGEDAQPGILEKAARLPDDGLVQPRLCKLHTADGRELVASHLSHRADGTVIMEFFIGARSEREADDRYEMRQDAIKKLRAHDTVAGFSACAVGLLRSQTGYDRVMCYRFHPDLHGEVIAEDTEQPESYLGLHYPATDIPEPARRQFALNKLRMISDVQDVSVPIVQSQSANGTLDLSFSKTRAVSPVHLRYLANMGVRSTLSLPIMVEDRLWGLMVCHHQSPKRLTTLEIHALELTAQVIELVFENILRSERDREIINAQELAFDFSQSRQSEDSLEEVAARLAEHFEVDAVAARIDGTWRPLWNWRAGELRMPHLHAACTDGVFVTDDLSNHITVDDNATDLVAGGAFLSLDAERNEYLILVRKEFRKDMTWAGKPAKPKAFDADGNAILEPRGSFARWDQVIAGKSRPFTDNDVLAFGVIVQSLRALVTSQRASSLSASKRELELVQSELRTQLLNTARSASLGELAAAIAHELNQPLTSISNFVSACRVLMRNDPANNLEKIGKLMENAVDETQRAGQIVRNLMQPGFERRLDFDPKEMLEQSVRLALTSSKQGGVELKLDIAPNLPDIFGDKVQLEQVVFNLVRNAVEAMEGLPNRRLTVSAKTVPDRMLRITVEDTGAGINPESLSTLFEPFRTSKPDGMGIGLSLCRSTIEAHNGQIWGENTATGARFGFTIPVSEKETGHAA